MNRISKTELVAFDAKMDPSARHTHTHGGRQVKVTKQASMQVNNSKIQKGSKKKSNEKKKKRRQTNRHAVWNKSRTRGAQEEGAKRHRRRTMKTGLTWGGNRRTNKDLLEQHREFAGTTQGVIN